LNIAAWENLLSYPDFDVPRLDRRSLFWQLETPHPYYTQRALAAGKGLVLSNFYHEPLILKNALLGSRLYLQAAHEYRLSLTYSAPVPLILGLYGQDEAPLRFWRLPAQTPLALWQETFSLDHLPPHTPLHLRLLVPDTQGEAVQLQQIGLTDSQAVDLPEITVGLVTFNRKDCIAQLLDQISTLAYPRERLHVVVVDNASTDGSSAMLAARYPWVQVIRNTENRGGSGGFNTFFKYLLAQSQPKPLAWLIDDDAQIERYSLLHLVRTLVAVPEAAVAGSVMMDLERPTIAYEAGGSLYQDRFGWCANLLQNELQQLSHIRERYWETGYAGAYSLLFRTALLPQVGIWHNYFLHVDDSEWGHRIQRLTGQKVVIALDSFIWHTLQGARKPFTTLRYYETRNFLNYFARYTSSKTVARVLLQNMRFGLRQLVIKRSDLCDFHLRGIDDFFHGPYGRNDSLRRSASLVKDAAGIIDAYRARHGQPPKRIYLLREINDYANDGQDHESALLRQLRQLAPQARLIETAFHPQTQLPRLGDSFLQLRYAKTRLGRALQALRAIFIHRSGVVILPFWNESMLANNLATLTAVYENHNYTLYWSDRPALLLTLARSAGRGLRWLWLTLRGSYTAHAADEI